MSRRVLVADDHQMFREGLRALLEANGLAVVGEAGTGREAVQSAADLRPDLAILDIVMPELNGVDAAREILRDDPSATIIHLTMHPEDVYVIEALRVGVKGYVLKSQGASDLLQAIQEVSRGAIYLSPAISRVVVEGCLADSVPPRDPLTLREREVLQLIAEGRTNKELAQELGISVKTSESHRVRIKRKIGVHHTAGLVLHAIRIGLIRP